MATPGRFLHVMMEMDLKLTSVEYVVFDEADRYVSRNNTDLLLQVYTVHNGNSSALSMYLIEVLIHQLILDLPVFYQM